MVELIHTEIAHPKLAHLTGLLERLKCRRDLVLFHQVIRPVQLVEVDAVHTHPLERRFAGAGDVFLGKIVPVGGVLVRVALFANAALGGDHDPVTHPGDFLERPAEYLLDQSVAVHV